MEGVIWYNIIYFIEAKRLYFEKRDWQDAHDFIFERKCMTNWDEIELMEKSLETWWNYLIHW